MTEVLMKTDLPLKLLKKGKVRDIYRLDDRLLMIATDRISAFDVVFPNGIPYKGKCLNQVSLFWFDKMEKVIPNHVIASQLDEFPSPARKEELEGRSVIVKKAQPIPAECIVRGYLAGSAWRSYQKTRQVCGIDLPEGMKESQRLEKPLFTPSTKAETGHDENISYERLEEVVGEDTARTLKEKSLEVYEKANDYANQRGIILADTKFEFGREPDTGKIILIDELLTPDSSRFWPASEWKPGTTPHALDKEYLRQYLLKSNWNREPPAPELPPQVVKETSQRYVEIYEKLTGEELDVRT